MTYVMQDLYHYIGGDLGTSPAGDLRPVSGLEMGKQRVLRRLMTNPGDYIYHPTYGAGLGSKVGQSLNVGEWTALIKGQMLLESCVSQDPKYPPKVTLTPLTNGVSAYITYTDAPSGVPVTLSFDVTV
jgi:hypothetical protein